MKRFLAVLCLAVLIGTVGIGSVAESGSGSSVSRLWLEYYADVEDNILRLLTATNDEFKKYEPGSMKESFITLAYCYYKMFATVRALRMIENEVCVQIESDPGYQGEISDLTQRLAMGWSLVGSSLDDAYQQWVSGELPKAEFADMVARMVESAVAPETVTE